LSGASTLSTLKNHSGKGRDENPCEAPGLTAKRTLASKSFIREAHTAGTERNAMKWSQSLPFRQFWPEILSGASTLSTLKNHSGKGRDENPCEAPGLTAKRTLASKSFIREAHTAGTERNAMK